MLYSIELLSSSVVTTFVHVDVHSIVNVQVCHNFISVFVGQSIIIHSGLIWSTIIFGLWASFVFVLSSAPIIFHAGNLSVIAQFTSGFALYVNVNVLHVAVHPISELLNIR